MWLQALEGLSKSSLAGALPALLGELFLHYNSNVNIMKEGKVKKARQKGSPKTAKPQSGVRPTVKLLPGAKPLAKPLARKRAAPTSTRKRSPLKPLKTLQSHLSGVFGLPRPTPSLLQHRAARRER